MGDGGGQGVFSLPCMAVKRGLDLAHSQHTKAYDINSRGLTSVEVFIAHQGRREGGRGVGDQEQGQSGRGGAW